ncbi:hypothetical protein GJU40_03720 [Bacillus lacus]|uniref:DUF308 domain-containing protein n=1 Tax=Metabacillus lacus TaxID=1983721 RepID=A0A7X2IX44_9BACI|nr:hypothetical protein [Metabacillus lacus]MRX71279.1 hypothetical protein [Metabacillus lacus]
MSDDKNYDYHNGMVNSDMKDDQDHIGTDENLGANSNQGDQYSQKGPSDQYADQSTQGDAGATASSRSYHTASGPTSSITPTYTNEDSSNQTGLQKEDNSDQYREETSAELTAPVSAGRDNNNKSSMNQGDQGGAGVMSGRSVGFLAIGLSILSLFVLPIILGAAGIIIGFIARRQGSKTLGAWAIGIGVVSLIMGMFITPFF